MRTLSGGRADGELLRDSYLFPDNASYTELVVEVSESYTLFTRFPCIRRSVRGCVRRTISRTQTRIQHRTVGLLISIRPSVRLSVGVATAQIMITRVRWQGGATVRKVL
jgi:hypothetical protein